MRLAVSLRNVSQSQSGTLWSTVNGYLQIIVGIHQGRSRKGIHVFCTSVWVWVCECVCVCVCTCTISISLSVKWAYCWTRQASHRRRAFLKFLPDFSAIFLANSGGKERPSFLQTWWSTLHTYMYREEGEGEREREGGRLELKLYTYKSPTNTPLQSWGQPPSLQGTYFVWLGWPYWWSCSRGWYDRWPCTSPWSSSEHAGHLLLAGLPLSAPQLWEKKLRMKVYKITAFFTQTLQS